MVIIIIIVVVGLVGIVIVIVIVATDRTVATIVGATGVGGTHAFATRINVALESSVGAEALGAKAVLERIVVVSVKIVLSLALGAQVGDGKADLATLRGNIVTVEAGVDGEQERGNSQDDDLEGVHGDVLVELSEMDGK